MRILLPIFLFACGTKDTPEDNCFIWGPDCEPTADCSTRSYTVPSTRGELDGVWDAEGQRFVFFGGDEGTKLCTKKFCEDVLDGRWKCPNEAKCLFKFQVCKSNKIRSC